MKSPRVFLAVLTFTALVSISARASDTTLFIGDSHSVMTFGQTLANRLGPAIQRYAVSSTSSADWLNEKLCPSASDCEFTYGYSTPAGDFEGTLPASFPGLGQLLIVTKPTRVIVALGTNDATYRCHLPVRESMQPFLETLLRIGSRSCVWVGPPKYSDGPLVESCGSAAGYNKFVSRMKKVIQGSGCRFIDSRNIIDPRTREILTADSGDKVHFSSATGRAWGEAVAEQIKRMGKQNSAGPVK